MYRELDPDKIIKTAVKLQQRIAERFPTSSLNQVCIELVEITQESREQAMEIREPKIWLRVGTAVFVLLGLGGLIYTVSRLNLVIGTMELDEFVQLVEAGINDLLLIGAALFFLTTVETRIKRARAINALHTLRAVAHVIDMHQLTKDPSRQTISGGKTTSSSPDPHMSYYELTRYLDYCSEMLSIIGKIAAIYAQNLPDAVVLDAANDLENLTTGLSRKIWQKIMIIQQVESATSQVVISSPAAATNAVAPID